MPRERQAKMENDAMLAEQAIKQAGEQQQIKMANDAIYLNDDGNGILFTKKLPENMWERIHLKQNDCFKISGMDEIFTVIGFDSEENSDASIKMRYSKWIRDGEVEVDSIYFMAMRGDLLERLTVLVNCPGSNGGGRKRKNRRKKKKSIKKKKKTIRKKNKIRRKKKKTRRKKNIK